VEEERERRLESLFEADLDNERGQPQSAAEGQQQAEEGSAAPAGMCDWIVWGCSVGTTSGRGAAATSWAATQREDMQGMSHFLHAACATCHVPCLFASCTWRSQHSICWTSTSNQAVFLGHTPLNPSGMNMRV
jgi:hypothetical protein